MPSFLFSSEIFKLMENPTGGFVYLFLHHCFDAGAVHRHKTVQQKNTAPTGAVFVIWLYVT